MSDYIVSARKYRPRSFDTLIGQDNIAKTLLNSIKRGQLAHAYLFCGPRGVGKTTTARIFAKMINCSSPGENGEPCGKCQSCVSFEEGNSYCIQELDAASNNSVDDIKELIDKVRIPPQVGKYSVYIIDEVHMLSASAFNAFLKTLEEPPEYAIFILATTEKHKILPTILSRCQTYDFNRITVDNIVRNLRMIAEKEKVGVDDESLHVIALKADGAMRDALTIFDQTVAFCGTDIRYEDVIRNLNVLDYEYSFSLVRCFLTGDYAQALCTFDEILKKGFNALHFISALSSHFRDLLVTKSGGADSLLELAGTVKARYAEQAAFCSEKFLYDALSLTMGCEQGYKMAVNQRLHIEFCLMRLCFLNKTADIAATPSPASAPAQPAARTPAPAPAPVQTAARTPAPASAPAQAAEDRARRRPAMGIGALSIRSMGRKDEQVASEAKNISDAPAPADEDIRTCWKKLCEISAANERLRNALATAVLEISGENDRKIVKYSVINDALRQWLESKNSRIEAKFRELLGSAGVDLRIDVQSNPDEGKLVYSQEDKAKEMIEKSPVAREIISEMGLEIK